MTFICGRAGVCALGAVVSAKLKDEALLHHYLISFSEASLNFFIWFADLVSDFHYNIQLSDLVMNLHNMH